MVMIIMITLLIIYSKFKQEAHEKTSFRPITIKNVGLHFYLFFSGGTKMLISSWLLIIPSDTMYTLTYVKLKQNT